MTLPAFANAVPKEDCEASDAGATVCVPPPVRVVVTVPNADALVSEAGERTMLVFMTTEPNADCEGMPVRGGVLCAAPGEGTADCDVSEATVTMRLPASGRGNPKADWLARAV
jgi:hypothetical protein